MQNLLTNHARDNLHEVILVKQLVEVNVRKQLLVVIAQGASSTFDKTFGECLQKESI